MNALNELFGKSNGFIETRDILPNKKVIQEFHRTIDEVINYTAQGDFYVGVCPREIESGREADINTITSLWVDLDITIELTMDKLTTFPFEPSMVVNSGHGFVAIDTFAAPNPAPSGRGLQGPLSINPEYTPAFRPEFRRID